MAHHIVDPEEYDEERVIAMPIRLPRSGHRREELFKLPNLSLERATFSTSLPCGVRQRKAADRSKGRGHRELTYPYDSRPGGTLRHQHSAGITSWPERNTHMTGSITAPGRAKL